jgi:hypothetical protein
VLACLQVPLFPLAARLRSEPDLKGEVVAVFEGNGNAARVIAASRKARDKGLQPGMTLPQARSLFPKLLARARDRESERAAQESLLEIADSFSPRVEDAGEGLIYLDLEGLPLPPLPPGEGRGEGAANANALPLQPETPHPVPSPQSKIQNPKSKIQTSPLHSLARDIIAAAEKASLPLKVGIAASKLAARVAAGLPDSPTVVPAGDEHRFLAPLPLSRLAPAIEIAEMLDRWGIRSIGCRKEKSRAAWGSSAASSTPPPAESTRARSSPACRRRPSRKGWTSNGRSSRSSPSSFSATRPSSVSSSAWNPRGSPA